MSFRSWRNARNNCCRRLERLVLRVRSLSMAPSLSISPCCARAATSTTRATKQGRVHWRIHDTAASASLSAPTVGHHHSMLQSFPHLLHLSLLPLRPLLPLRHRDAATRLCRPLVPCTIHAIHRSYVDMVSHNGELFPNKKNLPMNGARDTALERFQRGGVEKHRVSASQCVATTTMT